MRGSWRSSPTAHVVAERSVSKAAKQVVCTNVTGAGSTVAALTMKPSAGSRIVAPHCSHRAVTVACPLRPCASRPITVPHSRHRIRPDLPEGLDGRTRHRSARYPGRSDQARVSLRVENRQTVTRSHHHGWHVWHLLHITLHEARQGGHTARMPQMPPYRL